MNTYFIPDIYSYTGYKEVKYSNNALDFYCFDCGFACETKEEAVRLCKDIEEFCRRRKMRITDAYYVYIDFDGDIYSEAVGTYIFTTLEEVEETVKEALIDLERRYPDWYVLIDDYEVPLQTVIKEKEILDEFIEYGGDCFGNWEITIDYVGENL